MEAVKHDAGKPATHLLQFGALMEVSKVLRDGAVKYDDHNYRLGMKWSRLLGAMLRHLFLWAAGEDYDPESGHLHSAHFSCCALMLLDAQLHKLGEDDRWRPPPQTPKVPMWRRLFRRAKPKRGAPEVP